MTSDRRQGHGLVSNGTNGTRFSAAWKAETPANSRAAPRIARSGLRGPISDGTTPNAVGAGISRCRDDFDLGVKSVLDFMLNTQTAPSVSGVFC